MCIIALEALLTDTLVCGHLYLRSPSQNPVSTPIQTLLFRSYGHLVRAPTASTVPFFTFFSQASEHPRRGSFVRNWKLSSRLFSRPDWLPLGLRGWPQRCYCIQRDTVLVCETRIEIAVSVSQIWQLLSPWSVVYLIRLYSVQFGNN